MSTKSSASIVLALAVGGSVLFHLLALFVPDLDLTSAEEPQPLLAELRLPTPVSQKVSQIQPSAEPPKIPAKSPFTKSAPAAENSLLTQDAPITKSAAVSAPPPPQAPAATVSQAAMEPPLSAKGVIRYSVYKGLQGMEVGRATHTWEFAEGRYRITVMTETSGLAAFFKPIRMDYESQGKIIASGLQPEHFISRKNSAESGDNADFDWSAGQVNLTRDNRSYALTEGAQDFASFYYQLVFLPQLVDGMSMGVATPRKFERYRFEILGEELIETPVGNFRTLHLRIQTDSTIELWLALDRQRLPVKIRYTDKKGDAFEQVAVDIGSPKTP